MNYLDYLKALLLLLQYHEMLGFMTFNPLATAWVALHSVEVQNMVPVTAPEKNDQ